MLTMIDIWGSILAVLSHTDEGYLARNKIVCGLGSTL